MGTWDPYLLFVCCHFLLLCARLLVILGSFSISEVILLLLLWVGLCLQTTVGKRKIIKASYGKRNCVDNHGSTDNSHLVLCIDSHALANCPL